MTQFKVGDRVVINAEGRRRYGYYEGEKGDFGNPECEGTITTLGDWHSVDWDNGTFNSYKPVALDLVITSLENE